MIITYVYGREVLPYRHVILSVKCATESAVQMYLFFMHLRNKRTAS